jgi:hypothetical protein
MGTWGRLWGICWRPNKGRPLKGEAQQLSRSRRVSTDHTDFCADFPWGKLIAEQFMNTRRVVHFAFIARQHRFHGVPRRSRRHASNGITLGYCCGNAVFYLIWPTDDPETEETLPTCRFAGAGHVWCAVEIVRKETIGFSVFLLIGTDLLKQIHKQTSLSRLTIDHRSLSITCWLPKSEFQEVGRNTPFNRGVFCLLYYCLTGIP